MAKSRSKWWLLAIFYHTLRRRGNVGGNWWDLWSGFVNQVQEEEVEILSPEHQNSLPHFSLLLGCWGWHGGQVRG